MLDFPYEDLPEGTNEITQHILEAAFRVHTELGAGLLEKPYHLCMLAELRAMGLKAESEVPLPVRYRDMWIDCSDRMDLVVEDRVIVGIKAVDGIGKLHLAQALTYLRLAGKPLGLILNFNVPHMRMGIKRVILTPKTSESSVVS